MTRVEPNGCPAPHHTDYGACPRGTLHCWRSDICRREASRAAAAFYGMLKVSYWLASDGASLVDGFARQVVGTLAYRERILGIGLQRIAEVVRPAYLRSIGVPSPALTRAHRAAGFSCELFLYTRTGGFAAHVPGLRSISAAYDKLRELRPVCDAAGFDIERAVISGQGMVTRTMTWSHRGAIPRWGRGGDMPAGTDVCPVDPWRPCSCHRGAHRTCPRSSPYYVSPMTGGLRRIAKYLAQREAALQRRGLQAIALWLHNVLTLT